MHIEQNLDENTRLLNSQKTSVVDIYESLIRFMAREDALKKFLVYLVSEPFDQKKNANFLKKLKDHLHFLSRTASLPQSYETTLTKIALSEAFSDSVGVLTEKIWPTLLAGLLLHDGIAYFSQPLDRYGNSFADIMGGVSPNQLTWSSHLCGDFPDTYYFGIPLGLPIYIFLAASLYISIPKARWKWDKQKSALNINDNADRNENPHEDNEAILDLEVNTDSSLPGSADQRLFSVLWNKNLTSEQRSSELNSIKMQAKKGGWLERFYAIQSLAKIADSFDEFSLKLAGIDHDEDLEQFNNLREHAVEALNDQIKDFSIKYLPQHIYTEYQLWSLGENKSIPAHLIFSPLIFMPFYLLYSKARLIEMFVQKIIQLYEYLMQQKACEAQNKTFLFMPQFGNYECTVCGNSPYVSYDNVKTSQGCLEDLLSQHREPEEIFKYLDQILQHPNFTELDLSQQNWTKWALPQWKLFLDKVSNVTHHLNTFNLSSPIENPIFPNDHHIEPLRDFLKLVSIDKIDLNNQGIGDSLFREVLLGIQNGTLSYLDISSNQLTDESAAKLQKFMLSSPTLKDLKIAHNALSDAGVKHVVTNSTLTSLDISDTSFGSDGLEAIGSEISNKNSTLKELKISNNDLSLADMENFGGAVAKSSALEKLDMSNTNINDIQVSQFMTPFQGNKNSALKSVDFSNNPLTDQGMFLIINNTQNSTITAIYFNNNFLTDDGIDYISTVLNLTSLEKLGLADAKSFSADGVKKILINLPKTARSLDISNNNLGDNVADAFVDVFHNSTKCSLTHINLGSNLLTDNGGERVVRLFAAQNITDLSLDHNMITDKTVQSLAEVFPESKFVSLDLSHNKITNATGLESLATKLGGSNLEKLSVSNNNISDKVALKIAENFITPTPHITDVGKEKISLDETRAIRKAKPKTKMTDLDLSSNQIGTEGERGLCRVYANTKIPKKNLRLNNNPGNIDFHNCQISKANRLETFGIFNGNDRPAEIERPQRFPQQSNTNGLMALGAVLIPGVIFLITLYILYQRYFGQSSNSTQENQINPLRLIDQLDLDSDSCSDSESESFSM